MRHQRKAFPADERGATAIEYGLIVSLIAAAIIAGLSSTGGSINKTFNVVSANLTH